MSSNIAQQKKKQEIYQQIVSYRQLHPEVSYRNIGKLFHITGQRVHQILILKGVVKQGVNKTLLTHLYKSNKII